MYSDNEKVVLCGASAYEQKYYFNPDFDALPQQCLFQCRCFRLQNQRKGWQMHERIETDDT